MTNGAALEALIDGFFATHPPAHLGVAVSGGSDSLALMVLLHRWAQRRGATLHVATVNHGLRNEAEAEADGVARLSQSLNLPHTTLHWTGWDGQGNLQAAARHARYELLAKWARQSGLEQVAVGHTLDDQAETFLMRLARGAGVDGLSAMAPRWDHNGTTFVRPLLKVARGDLRQCLTDQGLRWVDDPSNDDPAFDRVRARSALAALGPLGISASGLAEVAAHLRKTRETLYFYTEKAAREIVQFQHGDIVIARAGLADLPDEIARRLLQHALRWVNGAPYAPRGAAMAGLLAAINDRRDTALQGCLITHDAGQLRLTREFNAVATLRSAPDAVWDGRWQLTGPVSDGLHLGAMGEAGLAQCPVSWRETGLPRQSILAAPALWSGEQLQAAPLCGWPQGWQVKLRRSPDDLFEAMLSG